MSNWLLNFNLRARTVRHSGNRKDIKMEGSRSKEGKSELIISSQKYTRRNAIRADKIFPRENLLTSMERFKIAKTEKGREYERGFGENGRGKIKRKIPADTYWRA